MGKRAGALERGRINQKLRTRAALLEATSAMLARGERPTVDEAAAAARVSRATAYRYFPTRDDLLNEALLHLQMEALDTEVRTRLGATEDPGERADAAESHIHGVAFGNEAANRLLLKLSMEKWLAGKKPAAGVPLRQARRRGLFEDALKPVRSSLGRERHDTLVASLCMLTGVESLVVLRDILGLGPRQSRKIKSWAVKALVRQALAEAAGTARAGRPRRR